MYCSKCGNKILDSDKFCPFCGAEKEYKKITIDNDLSLEALEKRAFLLIEESDFSTATEYVERIVSLDPENCNAYIAKALIKNRINNIDSLYEHYKNLYSKDQFNYIESCPEDSEHINKIINDYEIKNYLDEENIRKLYEYDRNVGTLLECREKQKKLIESEFQNDINLKRIQEFSDKKTKNRIKDIFKTYDNRIAEAKINDETLIEDRKKSYEDFLNKTDDIAKKEYENAIKNRETDYENVAKLVEKDNDIETLNKTRNTLLKLDDFKDSRNYLEIVDEKIKEKEQLLLKRKQEEKRKKIIIASLILLAITGSVLYYLFIYTPANKYKNANELLENRNYKEAIQIFKELDDYKDSKELLLDSYYKQGISYLDNKNYGDALRSFENIAGYKDTDNLIKEVKYQNAIEMLDKELVNDSYKLLSEIPEYKDAQGYIDRINNEYLLLENFENKDLSDVVKFLNEEKANYYIEKYYGGKGNNVIKTTPGSGYIKRNERICVDVSLGNISLNQYNGDGNGKLIFKIKIEKAGDKVRIRTTPVALENLSNKVSNAKAGQVYNVYEILHDSNYTWYRVGNKRWMATEKGWVSIIE